MGQTAQGLNSFPYLGFYSPLEARQLPVRPPVNTKIRDLGLLAYFGFAGLLAHSNTGLLPYCVTGLLWAYWLACKWASMQAGAAGYTGGLWWLAELGCTFLIAVLAGLVVRK